MPKRGPQNVVTDPEKGIAYIPVGRYAKDGYAIVDLDDLDVIGEFYWTADTPGYARTSAGLAYGKSIYMHRMLCPTAPGLTVDHINRDIRDNRRSNLREATRREQSINRSTHTYKTGNRTSKYKGVSRVKKTKPGFKDYYYWQYAIYSQDIPSGSIRGHTKTEEEAALKYNELAKHYQGDRAVLNQVELSK